MIQRLFLLLFIGCHLPAGMASAAAPSNDLVVNATNLGSGETAFGSANNTDATTQAGEPLPYGVTKTVWWKWTAPYSRWMQANTFGTWGDTVLAVYKFPIFTLPAVASNDQAASGGWAPASELFFYAVAGSTYYFQAGGAGLTSDVFLSVYPTDEPELRLIDLIFDPNPADVTATGRLVNAYIAVESELPLDRGILRIYQPDGEWMGDHVFDAATRISGDAFSGTYRVEVTVPRYAPAGRWLAGISLESWTGARMALATYGAWGDHGFLPSVSHNGIQVANRGFQDNVCPAVSVVVSPNPIDVSKASRTMRLRINVADHAGVAGGHAVIKTPQGHPFYVLELSTAVCFFGTPQSGYWEHDVELPRNAPTGQWSVEVVLRDVLGNACTHPPAVFSVTGSSDPYDLWAFLWGLWHTDPSPEADPDLDGLTNLQEYAFGLSPVVAEVGRCTNPEGMTAGLPVYFLNRIGGPAGQSFNFGVSFPRISAAADPALSYVVETSTDLVQWTADPGVFLEVTDLGEPYQYVHFATTPCSRPAQFVRVRVVR